MSQQQDVCEVTCIHKDKVMRLRKELDGSCSDRVSDLFKLLADQTRVTIVHALALEKELCVCDVCAVVGCSKATASHHLRLLKKWGLAKSRKEGKFVYYAMNDDAVRQLVKLTFLHEKSKEGQADQELAE
ncbi:ArsR/SmtB family transcription factor [Sporolactobacillus inulinus]|jgi:DNA-binding transcriptional ArsR family regulator|uniref:ArsR family transcriptional regulator n=1 Tax=Sporolactobacillus inulinus CASD TaxID=1069536 RepID=A0A0U1QLF4_9BACL|nr:metalloregulator ArsR/SmtB family transcription factor [Sporolactobacillus inulinus]KLI01613.1 ArsR family transcriptional regulator [Sporolactobacillus inulinus CASD]GEB77071.1 transcriptional regulator [Sporolactobacillus inulinus]